ncbi:lung seven transmembrane receptor-domain-containing protein [Polychytrium aggregatum]|uniref:lung seven transmembrane receptor-domain-containing protein n=1 Tax=Polychytrium aggregatum TaxID=110093 RepID=UPI0022FE4572|nr:lung seven transmembrane receptor-domain-containing protein [Polychytrium aggregatum]KAI9207933.1 lung seven transmembrane receptor-domain-containing protein [Polychytrium aggregatum]
MINQFFQVTGDYSAQPPTKVKYYVNQTGYYCAVAFSGHNMNAGPVNPWLAEVRFENPYGSLPAVDYPKLPFFGALSIVYFLVAALWLWKSFCYWRDLLPLQHMISGVIIFLMVEMAFNYGYYENYNIWGKSSIALLIIVAVLNAGRNSISFFMLLIVSLGYGVVRPTLGSTMKKCVTLALAHFAFGVLYTAGSMAIIDTDITVITILIFVLPLSMAMTVFYFWTLAGLQSTMRHLESRRQIVKLTMYRRLFRILLSSVIVLFVFFVVNSLSFSERDSDDWIVKQWQYRWILLDGWLNLLYLVVFLSIAYLWRPTENNQRYGLDEVMQDDYDDDLIASMGGANGGYNGQQIKLRTVPRVGDLEFGPDDDDDDDDDGVGYDVGVRESIDEVLQWAEENFGQPATEAVTHGNLVAVEDDEHAHG